MTIAISRVTTAMAKITHVIDGISACPCACGVGLGEADVEAPADPTAKYVVAYELP